MEASDWCYPLEAEHFSEDWSSPLSKRPTTEAWTNDDGWSRLPRLAVGSSIGVSGGWTVPLGGNWDARIRPNF
jgi:hypothetical protein